MIKKFLAMLAVAVLGVTGLTATPAQAVLGCSADSLCFYDSNYSTSWPMIDHDDADTSPGECFNMGSAHRNKTSYVRNWTDHNWIAFTGLNCVSNPGTLWANTSGNMGGIYQDNIESYSRVG